MPRRQQYSADDGPVDGGYAVGPGGGGGGAGTACGAHKRSLPFSITIADSISWSAGSTTAKSEPLICASWACPATVTSIFVTLGWMYPAWTTERPSGDGTATRSNSTAFA